MSGGLREQMPTVAAFIDEMRSAFGVETINDLIRAGMKGHPVFHAKENGHELGTPIPAPLFSVSGDALLAHVVRKEEPAQAARGGR